MTREVLHFFVLCPLTVHSFSVIAAAVSGNLIEAVPYSGLSDVGASSFVFSDRTLTFKDLGSYPSDCFYIRGPNDDRYTPSSSVQWMFSTDQDCTVYLDFWSGQENYGFANWDAGWNLSARSGVQFGSYGPGIVYEKNFPAGSIELYGNEGDAQLPNVGTYLALLCPVHVLTVTLTATETATSTVSSTTSMSTTSTDANVIAVAASGGNVAVVALPALTIGDPSFSDRTFTFATLGSYRSSCYYLRGPNNAKNTNAADVQWTITTLMDSTLYLDFWQDQDSLGFSSWNSGWEISSTTGFRIVEHGVALGPGIVYQKDFPAGQIELYGNAGNGVSTYLVTVCDRETTTTTTIALEVTAYSVFGNFMTLHPMSSLTIGDLVFTDRTLTLTNLGGYDSSCIYVRGPNDDFATPAEDVQWVITTNTDSTVYLDFWDDQDNLGFASWNTGWEASSVPGIVFHTYGPGVVYEQTVPAGDIFLYGNDGAMNPGSFIGTYVPIVCPVQPTTTTTTTAAPVSVLVSAVSGRLMQVVNVSDLQIGDFVFTDRSVVFSHLGSFSDSCLYIRGPNDDKDTPASLVQWLVNSSTVVTVYLDFWDDQEFYGFSQWSDGWYPAAQIGTQFDFYGPGVVYQKNFPAGEIELFGNDGSPGNGLPSVGTYLAFVCPPVSTMTSTTTTLTSTETMTMMFSAEAISGRSIELVPVHSLQTGDLVFTDRSFTLNTLGSYDSSCVYVRGPNNDKTTPAGDVQWLITSFGAAKVYLDFWADQDSLGFASWNDGWLISDRTGISLLGHGNAGYGPGIVYEKTVPAGDILLYGNAGQGVDSYLAILCPSALTLTLTETMTTATVTETTKTVTGTTTNSPTETATTSTSKTMSRTTTTLSTTTTTSSNATMATSTSTTGTATSSTITSTTTTITTSMTSSTGTTITGTSSTGTTITVTTTTLPWITATRTTFTWTTVTRTGDELMFADLNCLNGMCGEEAEDAAWFGATWIIPGGLRATTINWALSITAATLFSLALCCCLCICYRRRRKRRSPPAWGEAPTPEASNAAASAARIQSTRGTPPPGGLQWPGRPEPEPAQVQVRTESRESGGSARGSRLGSSLQPRTASRGSSRSGAPIAERV